MTTHHLSERSNSNQSKSHTRRTEHFHDWKKHAERPNGSDVGLAMGLVDFLKRFSLLRFPIERLHDVHPCDVFLNKLVDFGDLVPHVLQTHS